MAFPGSPTEAAALREACVRAVDGICSCPQAAWRIGGRTCEVCIVRERLWQQLGQSSLAATQLLYVKHQAARYVAAEMQETA